MENGKKSTQAIDLRSVHYFIPSYLGDGTFQQVVADEPLKNLKGEDTGFSISRQVWRFNKNKATHYEEVSMNNCPLYPGWKGHQ